MHRRLTRENGGTREGRMSVWLARGNLGLGVGTPLNQDEKMLMRENSRPEKVKEEFPQ